MKRNLLKIILSKITIINSVLFLVACNSMSLNFVIAQADAIKSLNYLKYDKHSYNSQYLFAFIEGLFHNAPADQKSSNEVLEMTKVNGNQGVVIKEMDINNENLDLDKVLTNPSQLNQQLNAIANESTRVISSTTEFWYGVAKDIFVVNYGDKVNNNESRKFKEFIIKLRYASFANKDLPYRENGQEFFQERPALWHDGKNVLASDFVNSVRYVLDASNGSANVDDLTDTSKVGINNAKAYLDKKVSEDNLGIKAIGNDLLYINFATGFNPTAVAKLTADFIKKLFSPALLPSRKDVIAKYGNLWGTSKDTVLGNGAFKIYRTDFDNDTVFLKNEDYWDRERISANAWKYKVVQDTVTSSILFESGVVGKSDIPKELLPRFLNNPVVRRFLFQGMSTRDSEYLAFNNTSNKFDNEKGRYLRNAIQYGIDRHEFLLSQNDNGGIPADTLTTLLSRNDGNDMAFRETLVTDNGQPKYEVDVVGDNAKQDRVPLAYYRFDQRVFYDKVQANIDRTDRLHNKAIAQKFYNKYRLMSSGKETLTLLYDLSASTTASDAMLLLKQKIERNFPEINIKLEGQARSIFLSKLGVGEYDLLYTSVKGKKINAFDYLEILAKVYWDQGDLRYVQNPTGTWNFYENFIKKFNSVTELRNSNSFFKDFEVTPSEFLWLNALFTPYDTNGNNFAVNGLVKNRENNIDNFQQLNAILQNKFGDGLASLFDKETGFKMPQDKDYAISGLATFAPHIAFRIYAILEAIIKLESPVIMLSNSSAGWAGERILGYSQAAGTNMPEVQWGYNCQNKPNNSIFPLKGCEAFNKDDLSI
ncbi:ABC transporter substrate-binding protein [Spiroplasma endosymbiont of Nephrotoma flavescens]|uniref:ABC transporter substrate-binding protein n=1 Tax=Spiroplasma endosymbiont of Nephrotoma flavescens TaxID=3066302 RepID=UPI00313E33FF